VDDSSSANSVESHRRFSQMIKKGVANTRHQYHRKFHDAQTVDWMGRIIDTLNDDPESIQAIPHTDGSILDKISLYKFKDHGIEFPGHVELDAILNQELPHFAAWLLSWTPPEFTRGSERYGVKSYHHPIKVVVGLARVLRVLGPVPQAVFQGPPRGNGMGGHGNRVAIGLPERRVFAGLGQNVCANVTRLGPDAGKSFLDGRAVETKDRAWYHDLEDHAPSSGDGITGPEVFNPPKAPTPTKENPNE